MYLNKNRITLDKSPAFDFLSDISNLNDYDLSKKIMDYFEGAINWTFVLGDLDDYGSEYNTIGQLINEHDLNPAIVVTEIFGFHDYKKLLLLKQLELVSVAEDDEQGDELCELDDQWILNDAKTRLT